MKKFYIWTLIVLFSATLLGCEMSKGAGKDIENAGQSIQKAVEKNQ